MKMVERPISQKVVNVKWKRAHRALSIGVKVRAIVANAKT